jgi:DNA-directed RNA polymerase subunit RPC12/RpoP
MSITKIYKCDICSSEISSIENLFGIRFSNMHDFTLSEARATEGKHICHNCAKQLKDCLNGEIASNILDESGWVKVV